MPFPDLAWFAVSLILVVILDFAFTLNIGRTWSIMFKKPLAVRYSLVVPLRLVLLVTTAAAGTVVIRHGSNTMDGHMVLLILSFAALAAYSSFLSMKQVRDA